MVQTTKIELVCIPTPDLEFDYSGSVWNKERTIQSKVRTTTGLD